MNMKYASGILFAAMLVGCGQEGSAPTVPQQDARTMDQAASPPETPPREAGTRLAVPLPEGVDLAFSYHVRGDNVVEREDRSDRRRIGLDYLEGDQESIFVSIENSLAEKGFTEFERDKNANGNIRAKFRKPQFGIVIVTVTPVGDERVSHDGGRGRVNLDWPAP